MAAHARFWVEVGTTEVGTIVVAKNELWSENLILWNCMLCPFTGIRGLLHAR